MLFDRSGNLVARGAVAVRKALAPQPGWAEQDPQYLWQCLGDACRALWKHTDRTADIEACALTTLRASVVAVDSDGRALRNAIMWPDERRTDSVAPVGGWRGLALRLAGLGPTLRYFQSEAEANWLALHEPECWQRTDKFLLLSGYLHYRLTGHFRDADAAQIGYLPFDFRRRQWLSEKSWKWQVLPSLRPALLPQLVASGELLGTISADAARDTGLPAGLPVIAAGADKACESLGAGAATAGVGCLSFGTAATITVVSDRYIAPARLVPPYPAAQPGKWTLESQLNTGFWLIGWFLEQFGAPERKRAASLDVSPESLLDDLLHRCAPGAAGLLSQPYWSPGLRAPGPEARGALIGLSSAHGRAEIYRALIEGILMALRQGKERIEQRSLAVARLFVAGGGSRSDAIVQIAANILGQRISRAQTAETSALGAAINAAVGLDWYRDHNEAVTAMTRPGASFEPDEQQRARYDAIYRDAYLPLYRRLRPVYRSLVALR